MQRRHQRALAESRTLAVRALPLLRPLGWLGRGWQDLRHCPVPGLLHGLAVAGFGALLLAVGHRRFWLLAGAFSGFLLVAPIVATGLYAVSRERARGNAATLATALRVWTPRDGRLVLFGALLALAGSGWVLTSASLITAFAGARVDNPADFLREVVLARSGWLFEAWLMLGGVLAAPMFASSVVALPLLLDRQVSVPGAVLSSWRVVMAHPTPLALWAALILGLTLLGMATALCGLVLMVPWLAHASWHAYGDLVDPSGLEPPP